MRGRLAIAVVTLLTIGACSSVQESAQGLRDRLSDLSVDSALEGLRDCDRLSSAFVGVVESAADTIDSLAERTDGRVPETQIRETVDNIAVSRYFDIAERIGCAQLQQRVDTLEQLRDIAPGTPAGADLLDEIVRQVEAQ